MATQKTPFEMRFHTDPEKTRQSAERQIIEKAMKDDAFRQKLISDPKAAISQELGVELPSSLKFHILQETSDTAYMVLPYKMTTEDISKLKSVASAEQIAANNTGSTATQFGCCC